MTDAEWLQLLWPIWLDDWYTAGGQDHRRDLLAAKRRIEATIGWTWDPPYGWDHPPHPLTDIPEF